MRLAILILSVVFCSHLHAQTTASSTETEPLLFTIGFPATDKRYHYAKSILNTAFNQFGYHIELMSSLSGREIHFAITDKADGISATVEQKYWRYAPDKLMQIDKPFVAVRNVAIARKGIELPQNWKDLSESELVVVIVRHHYSAKAYLKNAAIVEVETVDQALEVFEANRADILVSFEIGTEVTGADILSTIDTQPFVTLSQRPLYTFIRKDLNIPLDALSNAIQQALKDTPWPGQEEILLSTMKNPAKSS